MDGEGILRSWNNMLKYNVRIFNVAGKGNLRTGLEKMKQPSDQENLYYILRSLGFTYAQRLEGWSNTV